MIKKKLYMIWFIGLISVAAGFKIWLIFSDLVPFNSDEAIVGLMARHILRGDWPVFFYGQAYMGSLEASLVAAAFTLFGPQVWVIRLVQTILYLLLIISTVFIGRLFFGSQRAGLIAGSLLAIPTVNLTLYTTASLGGYGVALLMGNLLLITSWKGVYCESINSQSFRKFITMIGFGFFAGFGLWANGLTLVYSIPCFLFILYHIVRTHSLKQTARFGFAIFIGIVIGTIPLWGFGLQNGLSAMVGELMGQAVAVGTGPFLQQVSIHLGNYLLFGTTVLFGLRPPWDIIWLGLPFIPFVLMLWGIVMVHWVRVNLNPDPWRPGFALLFGVLAVFTAGFLLTPFGIDPSGRYFLPLGICIAIVGGAMFDRWIKFQPKAWAAIIFLLGFHIWGNLESAMKIPPGFTTQFYAPARVDMGYMDELISFLEDKHEIRGYTNYWVSYPLAFISQEKIIFTPRLPYHPDLRYTPRDNRYYPYHRLVEDSQQIAYITTHNPNLDSRLIEALTRMEISWKEERIGDFVVYYDLSLPMRPSEIEFSLDQ